MRSGRVAVEDVPAPQVGEKCVLVLVEHSCLSSGTESHSLQSSGTAQYIKSWLHPKKIQKVLGVIQQYGLQRTFSLAKSRLSGVRATGYSVSGRVIQVGKKVKNFKVGDRVACAGAGVANHAEVVNVPVNLVVRVPQGLEMREASTVTLGAIALQSIRRTKPELGDKVAVIGLGVLGQLVVQMLNNCGCQVIAVDIDRYRVELACKNGASYGICPSDGSGFLEDIYNYTNHIGVDAVLLCAATRDSALINEALKSIRKKGKLVIVGDIGLDIERENIYAKEIDVLISTSYGPGRYDPFYEEKGNDYPLAYVRWTENRNMEEYLRLVSLGKVDLSSLFGKIVPVESAQEAFNIISSPNSQELLVTLSYPCDREKIQRKVAIKTSKREAGEIKVAIVGGGGFVQSMHLPNFSRLSKKYVIHAVMSRNGVTAKNIAEQYGAKYVTTDYQEIVADPDVELVVIATRHDLHGAMVLKALNSGKNVFVEKPLALSRKELDHIKLFYSEHRGEAPKLLTGFNRRFSAVATKIKSLLHGRRTPLIANYRLNAGYIPVDNWVHTEEGGGRNVGEACHIYDLFNYFTDSDIVDVTAMSITPGSNKWNTNDNFVVSLKYLDGSVCTLTYTALGHVAFPKEMLDIYCDGMVISMNDYKEVSLAGSRSESWKFPASGKGHFEELDLFADYINGKRQSFISVDEQLSASYTALDVEELISSSV